MNKQERFLARRLFLTLSAIVGLMVIFVLSVTVFAPKVGSLFGFLSKYRNQEDWSTKLKPSPPIFTNIPESTKEKELKIEGHAQAGLTVVLYVNGPEKARTTSGSDGVFVFDKVKLISGRNNIFGKVIDLRGNESENSQAHVIEVDTSSPRLEIISPMPGETVKNLDSRIKIRGKTNEKCVIRVNDHTAVQKPDYTFEILLGAKEGSVEIKVVATDEAGNQAEQKFTITYQKGV